MIVLVPLDGKSILLALTFSQFTSLRQQVVCADTGGLALPRTATDLAEATVSRTDPLSELLPLECCRSKSTSDSSGAESVSRAAWHGPESWNPVAPAALAWHAHVPGFSHQSFPCKPICCECML